MDALLQLLSVSTLDSVYLLDALGFNYLLSKKKSQYVSFQAAFKKKATWQLQILLTFVITSPLLISMKREMRIFVLIRVFLPHMYFVIFILGQAGNTLVFVILSFYMKLKTLTETDSTFAEHGYSWVGFSLDPHSGHTLLLRSGLQAVYMSYYMGLVYTSVLTLMSITFDQLIAVIFATKAHVSNQNNDMGKLISVLTWLVS